MKKEKRFTGYDIGKKSELDIHSVLLAFGAVLILVWTSSIHIKEHAGFPVGIVISLILCFYFACILGYSYGSIEIASDGIHYRNALFKKKILRWESITGVYKTKSFIGSSESIDVICCVLGNKKQKMNFSFDLAVFREKSYFSIGYTEPRMKEIYSNYLKHHVD